MNDASKSLLSEAGALSDVERINGELDKIFLSARLVGIGIAFMPDAKGRREGLRERGGGWGIEGLSGPQTHVHHHDYLRGSLFFRCSADKLGSVRIPGMNAEWRNFTDLGQEQVTIDDSHGNPSPALSFGPHKFEVHASSGPDQL